MHKEESWDDFCDDVCYECRGLGDDYYFDENGDMQSICDTCPFSDIGVEE